MSCDTVSKLIILLAALFLILIGIFSIFTKNVAAPFQVVFGIISKTAKMPSALFLASRVGTFSCPCPLD